MAKKTTAHVFYRAQRRILADIDGDVLPYNVDNFAELHNYVDANVYLLDDRGDKDATMATLRTAVKELDLWLHERAAVIRARMPRSNPVTMTRQRVTELRAAPVIDAATERLILDTARAMVRRGGLINRGMNEVIMLDGRPWTIQTDRIGDVIYAVLKHGRQSQYLVLGHPKR